MLDDHFNSLCDGRAIENESHGVTMAVDKSPSSGQSLRTSNLFEYKKSIKGVYNGPSRQSEQTPTTTEGRGKILSFLSSLQLRNATDSSSNRSR